MMDRRLSNVQLMQQRTSRSNSAQSQTISEPDQQQQQFYYPRPSVVRQPAAVPPVFNQQQQQQQQRQPSNAYSYYNYQAQAGFNKRRRTTFWETLTGLVCSLGALATRAAKMAARKAEPL